MRYSFSIAGLDNIYNLEYMSKTLTPQEKKRLRLEICASLSKTFLPLHACLLEKDGAGIVLSGIGGSGKSILASALEPLGYRQAAKDFIVVWEEKGKLWGGDLNFQSVNSGKKAISIEKLVFLNKTDPRDLYRFDIHNATKFYAESLYPQPEATSAKHSSGKIFRQLLANHFVLGNRISPEKWVKTFDSWDVVDQVCSALVKTCLPAGRQNLLNKKIFEFSKRKEEFIKRTAFTLIACLSVHDKKMKDNEFLKFFLLIKKASADERNFVKKAVNWALRQIGKRNKKLNKEAIKLALQLRSGQTKSEKWIGSNALTELTSKAVQERLTNKVKNGK